MNVTLIVDIFESASKLKKIKWISGAHPGFPERGGAEPPGVPTYKFARFSQKLLEIKKILVHRGGNAEGTPRWIRHWI